MYVCVCKGITDSQIKDAVCAGASSLKQVRKQLGVSSQCGKCGILAKQIVEQALYKEADHVGESQFYAVS